MSSYWSSYYDWIFSSNQQKKTLSESIKENIYSNINETVNIISPMIQQNVNTCITNCIEGFRQGVKEIIKENKPSFNNKEHINMVRDNTKNYFYNMFTSLFLFFVPKKNKNT